jgi:hypothetical protein
MSMQETDERGPGLVAAHESGWWESGPFPSFWTAPDAFRALLPTTNGLGPACCWSAWESTSSCCGVHLVLWQRPDPGRRRREAAGASAMGSPCVFPNPTCNALRGRAMLGCRVFFHCRKKKL